MKKIVIMVIALVLLVAMSTSAFAASKYYIKKDDGGTISVRIAAGSSQEKIGKLSHGDEVMVEAKGNDWARIVYGSYGSAYIRAKYLSKSKPDPVYMKGYSSSSSSKSSSSKSTSTKSTSSSSSTANDTVKEITNSYNNFKAVTYTATVQPASNSRNINLRWGPSKNLPVMTTKQPGTELKVIAQNGSWCQVLDEETGEVGFMMKKFLKETEQETQVAEIAQTNGVG